MLKILDWLKFTSGARNHYLIQAVNNQIQPVSTRQQKGGAYS